jgi:hypothetical protein
MISPSILFCLTSAPSVSTRTYPPRFIHIVFLNRDGSSTRIVFLSGKEHEYKLLPSPLITRAMDWLAVRVDGGVDVSSAAAATFLFGRAIASFKYGSIREVYIRRGSFEGSSLHGEKLGDRFWVRL